MGLIVGLSFLLIGQYLQHLLHTGRNDSLLIGKGCLATLASVSGLAGRVGFLDPGPNDQFAYLNGHNFRWLETDADIR